MAMNHAEASGQFNAATALTPVPIKQKVLFKSQGKSTRSGLVTNLFRR
jgi:hypothetical protein